MELTVLNINKFVDVNKLRPVTELTFFEATGTPTDGGLFSLSIFGRAGSDDRRRRWGYIDLGGKFLHPLIYKTLCQLDRKFADLIGCQRRVRLSRTGEFIECEEGEPGAWTGLDSLYANWEKISWGTAEAGSQRAERVNLLKIVPKELAFVTKWPVMPASYRDVDSSSGSRIKQIPKINYLYIQVMTSSPTTVSGLLFADGARKRRAQDALLELHHSTLELIAGKKGLIQDRVLGKYTDWAVRGVLSGPALAKADHPGDQEVPFGSMGIPLYLIVNMYQPFLIKRIGEILDIYADGNAERLLVRSDKDGVKDPVYTEIPYDARVQLGPDLYKKWIARFMRSQENRLDKLSVTTGKGKEITIPLYDAYLGRPTTLLDLFYIAAADVIADKYVVFTRYPVEDFRAPHYAKPVILTTEATTSQSIRDRVFKTYPAVDANMRWVDSFRINASYARAMGADFDGDTHRVVGLFTQEANAEAERMIQKATNFCDGQGQYGRPLGNEAVLCLYALTK